MNWCTWYLFVEHTYINTHIYYIYIYICIRDVIVKHIWHTALLLTPAWNPEELQIDFGRTETNVKFQGVSSEKKSSSPMSHARLHNRLQRDLQSWKKYFKGFQSQSSAQSLFIGMPVLISWDVSHFAWDPYKDWIWHTKAHINNIQWYETVDKLPWISELHWLPFSAQMQARSSQPSFLTIYSHQQKHTELHTQKRS